MTLAADCVIVSDIHLRHPDDERARLLLELIARASAGQVQYFLLLGDIFDFCFGAQRFYRNRFAEVGAALTRLAASDTKVIFFEGNHEIDMCRVGWDGVSIVTEGTQRLIVSDEITLQIAHGDLVYASKGYLRFRNLIKNWMSRLLAQWFVPGWLLNRFALHHSELSRAQDDTRTLDHDALRRAIEDWLHPHANCVGLFGHFHVPYFESIANNNMMVSVESWDTPNALIIRGREFTRLEVGGSWQESRAVPVLDKSKM